MVPTNLRVVLRLRAGACVGGGCWQSFRRKDGQRLSVAAGSIPYHHTTGGINGYEAVVVTRNGSDQADAAQRGP